MHHLLVLYVFAALLFADSKTSDPQSSPAQLPNGPYLALSEYYPSLNDSIRVKNDSLIVYKDPGYGYGALFSFIYTYTFLEDSTLVLEGLSHFVDFEPGKSFARVEEYDWHGDTLYLKQEEEDFMLQFKGRVVERYALKATLLEEE